jgi:hypothetical protein
MKIQLKPFAAALCLAGFIAVPAMAATSSSDNNLTQVATGNEQSVPSVEPNSTFVAQPVTHTAPAHKVKRAHKRVAHRHRVVAPATYTASAAPVPNDVAPKTSLTGRDLVKLIGEEQEFLPFDLDVPGQAFVSTGPYVGVPIQFAGTNLIVNSPSVNTDLQLLGIRKNISKQLNAMGGEINKEPYHSHLLLSGLIEAQADYIHEGGRPNTSDIDLSSVSIDATVLGPSPWMLGFIELNYDNGTPQASVFEGTVNYRVANSRVYVNKGFITFGNLTCSPFYGTIGQYYVPFGTYSSVMVSDTLTKVLARTKARAITVGFQPQEANTFYGSGFFFRGDTHASSVSRINNGGVNLGYKFDAGVVSGNVGGGVIGNLADSGGMQFGNGFDRNEQIVHPVAAYDVRGTFSILQNIDVITEFVSAMRSYNSNDMSYQGRGAKPWALDLEAAYSFPILDNRPSSIGIGYGKSREALSLGVPLTRESLVLNTSLFRNTLQSVEFRHDSEYARSAVATGAGGVASPSESGKGDNAVTAQFDYYF